MSGLRMKVKCECNRRFRAKSKLAGRTVKCPHCERPISIPSQAFDQHGNSVDAPADANAEPEPLGLGWKRCPQCRVAQPESADTCSDCGYSESEAKTRRRVLDGEIIFRRRLVPIVSVIAVISCFVQSQMNGPLFLLFFVVLGLCGLITACVSQIHDISKTRVFVLCLIAFEVIGGARILYGVLIGMHRFKYLAWMMFVMPLLGWAVLSINFSTRGRRRWSGRGDGGDWSYGSGSGSCGGSSCGSSCGSRCGGGCGGGGCGGCGGD